MAGSYCTWNNLAPLPDTWYDLAYSYKKKRWLRWNEICVLDLATQIYQKTIVSVPVGPLLKKRIGASVRNKNYVDKPSLTSKVLIRTFRIQYSAIPHAFLISKLFLELQANHSAFVEPLLVVKIFVSANPKHVSSVEPLLVAKIFIEATLIDTSLIEPLLVAKIFIETEVCEYQTISGRLIIFVRITSNLIETTGANVTLVDKKYLASDMTSEASLFPILGGPEYLQCQLWNYGNLVPTISFYGGRLSATLFNASALLAALAKYEMQSICNQADDITAELTLKGRFLVSVLSQVTSTEPNLLQKDGKLSTVLIQEAFVACSLGLSKETFQTSIYQTSSTSSQFTRCYWKDTPYLNVETIGDDVFVTQSEGAVVLLYGSGVDAWCEDGETPLMVTPGAGIDTEEVYADIPEIEWLIGGDGTINSTEVWVEHSDPRCTWTFLAPLPTTWNEFGYAPQLGRWYKWNELCDFDEAEWLTREYICESLSRCCLKQETSFTSELVIKNVLLTRTEQITYIVANMPVSSYLSVHVVQETSLPAILILNPIKILLEKIQESYLVCRLRTDVAHISVSIAQHCFVIATLKDTSGNLSSFISQESYAGGYLRIDRATLSASIVQEQVIEAKLLFNVEKISSNINQLFYLYSNLETDLDFCQFEVTQKVFILSKLAFKVVVAVAWEQETSLVPILTLALPLDLDFIVSQESCISSALTTKVGLSATVWSPNSIEYAYLNGDGLIRVTCWQGADASAMLTVKPQLEATITQANLLISFLTHSIKKLSSNITQTSSLHCDLDGRLHLSSDITQDSSLYVVKIRFISNFVASLVIESSATNTKLSNFLRLDGTITQEQSALPYITPAKKCICTVINETHIAGSLFLIEVDSLHTEPLQISKLTADLLVTSGLMVLEVTQHISVYAFMSKKTFFVCALTQNNSIHATVVHTESISCSIVQEVYFVADLIAPAVLLASEVSQGNVVTSLLRLAETLSTSVYHENTMVAVVTIKILLKTSITNESYIDYANIDGEGCLRTKQWQFSSLSPLLSTRNLLACFLVHKNTVFGGVGSTVRLSSKIDTNSYIERAYLNGDGILSSNKFQFSYTTTTLTSSAQLGCSITQKSSVIISAIWASWLSCSVTSRSSTKWAYLNGDGVLRSTICNFNYVSAIVKSAVTLRAILSEVSLTNIIVHSTTTLRSTLIQESHMLWAYLNGGGVLRTQLWQFNAAINDLWVRSSLVSNVKQINYVDTAPISIQHLKSSLWAYTFVVAHAESTSRLSNVSAQKAYIDWAYINGDGVLRTKNWQFSSSALSQTSCVALNSNAIQSTYIDITTRQINYIESLINQETRLEFAILNGDDELRIKVTQFNNITSLLSSRPSLLAGITQRNIIIPAQLYKTSYLKTKRIIVQNSNVNWAYLNNEGAIRCEATNVSSVSAGLGTGKDASIIIGQNTFIVSSVKLVSQLGLTIYQESNLVGEIIEATEVFLNAAIIQESYIDWAYINGDGVLRAVLWNFSYTDMKLSISRQALFAEIWQNSSILFDLIGAFTIVCFNETSIVATITLKFVLEIKVIQESSIPIADLDGKGKLRSTEWQFNATVVVMHSSPKAKSIVNQQSFLSPGMSATVHTSCNLSQRTCIEWAYINGNGILRASIVNFNYLVCESTEAINLKFVKSQATSTVNSTRSFTRITNFISQRSCIGWAYINGDGVLRAAQWQSNSFQATLSTSFGLKTNVTVASSINAGMGTTSMLASNIVIDTFVLPYLNGAGELRTSEWQFSSILTTLTTRVSLLFGAFQVNAVRSVLTIAKEMLSLSCCQESYSEWAYLNGDGVLRCNITNFNYALSECNSVVSLDSSVTQKINVLTAASKIARVSTNVGNKTSIKRAVINGHGELSLEAWSFSSVAANVTINISIAATVGQSTNAMSSIDVPFSGMASVLYQTSYIEWAHINGGGVLRTGLWQRQYLDNSIASVTYLSTIIIQWAGIASFANSRVSIGTDIVNTSYIDWAYLNGGGVLRSSIFNFNSTNPILTDIVRMGSYVGQYNSVSSTCSLYSYQYLVTDTTQVNSIGFTFSLTVRIETKITELCSLDWAYLNGGGVLRATLWQISFVDSVVVTCTIFLSGKIRQVPFLSANLSIKASCLTSILGNKAYLCPVIINGAGQLNIVIWNFSSVIAFATTKVSLTATVGQSAWITVFMVVPFSGVAVKLDQSACIDWAHINGDGILRTTAWQRTRVDVSASSVKQLGVGIGQRDVCMPYIKLTTYVSVEIENNSYIDWAYIDGSGVLRSSIFNFNDIVSTLTDIVRQDVDIRQYNLVTAVCLTYRYQSLTTEINQFVSIKIIGSLTVRLEVQINESPSLGWAYINGEGVLRTSLWQRSFTAQFVISCSIFIRCQLWQDSYSVSNLSVKASYLASVVWNKTYLRPVIIDGAGKFNSSVWNFSKVLIGLTTKVNFYASLLHKTFVEAPPIISTASISSAIMHQTLLSYAYINGGGVLRCSLTERSSVSLSFNTILTMEGSLTQKHNITVSSKTFIHLSIQVWRDVKLTAYLNGDGILMLTCWGFSYITANLHTIVPIRSLTAQNSLIHISIKSVSELSITLNQENYIEWAYINGDGILRTKLWQFTAKESALKVLTPIHITLTQENYLKAAVSIKHALSVSLTVESYIEWAYINGGGVLRTKLWQISMVLPSLFYQKSLSSGINNISSVDAFFTKTTYLEASFYQSCFTYPRLHINGYCTWDELASPPIDWWHFAYSSLYGRWIHWSGTNGLCEEFEIRIDTAYQFSECLPGLTLRVSSKIDMAQTSSAISSCNVTSLLSVVVCNISRIGWAYINGDGVLKATVTQIASSISILYSDVRLKNVMLQDQSVSASLITTSSLEFISNQESYIDWAYVDGGGILRVTLFDFSVVAAELTTRIFISIQLVQSVSIKIDGILATILKLTITQTNDVKVDLHSISILRAVFNNESSIPIADLDWNGKLRSKIWQFHYVSVQIFSSIKTTLYIVQTNILLASMFKATFLHSRLTQEAYIGYALLNGEGELRTSQYQFNRVICDLTTVFVLKCNITQEHFGYQPIKTTKVLNVAITQSCNIGWAYLNGGGVLRSTLWQRQGLVPELYSTFPIRSSVAQSTELNVTTRSISLINHIAMQQSYVDWAYINGGGVLRTKLWKFDTIIANLTISSFVLKCSLTSTAKIEASLSIVSKGLKTILRNLNNVGISLHTRITLNSVLTCLSEVRWAYINGDGVLRTEGWQFNSVISVLSSKEIAESIIKESTLVAPTLTSVSLLKSTTNNVNLIKYAYVNGGGVLRTENWQFGFISADLVVTKTVSIEAYMNQQTNASSWVWTNKQLFAAVTHNSYIEWAYINGEGVLRTKFFNFTNVITELTSKVTVKSYFTQVSVTVNSCASISYFEAQEISQASYLPWVHINGYGLLRTALIQFITIHPNISLSSVSLNCVLEQGMNVDFDLSMAVYFLGSCTQTSNAYGVVKLSEQLESTFVNTSCIDWAFINGGGILRAKFWNFNYPISHQTYSKTLSIIVAQETILVPSVSTSAYLEAYLTQEPYIDWAYLNGDGVLRSRLWAFSECNAVVTIECYIVSTITDTSNFSGNLFIKTNLSTISVNESIIIANLTKKDFLSINIVNTSYIGWAYINGDGVLRTTISQRSNPLPRLVTKIKTKATVGQVVNTVCSSSKHVFLFTSISNNSYFDSADLDGAGKLRTKKWQFSRVESWLSLKQHLSISIVQESFFTAGSITYKGLAAHITHHNIIRRSDLDGDGKLWGTIFNFNYVEPKLFLKLFMDVSINQENIIILKNQIKTTSRVAISVHQATYIDWAYLNGEGVLRTELWQSDSFIPEILSYISVQAIVIQISDFVSLLEIPKSLMASKMNQISYISWAFINGGGVLRTSLSQLQVVTTLLHTRKQCYSTVLKEGTSIVCRLSTISTLQLTVSTSSYLDWAYINGNGVLRTKLWQFNDIDFIANIVSYCKISICQHSEFVVVLETKAALTAKIDQVNYIDFAYMNGAGKLRTRLWCFSETSSDLWNTCPIYSEITQELYITSTLIHHEDLYSIITNEQTVIVDLVYKQDIQLNVTQESSVSVLIFDGIVLKSICYQETLVNVSVPHAVNYLSTEILEINMVKATLTNNINLSVSIGQSSYIVSKTVIKVSLSNEIGQLSWVIFTSKNYIPLKTSIWQITTAVGHIRDSTLGHISCPAIELATTDKDIRIYVHATRLSIQLFDDGSGNKSIKVYQGFHDRDIKVYNNNENKRIMLYENNEDRFIELYDDGHDLMVRLYQPDGLTIEVYEGSQSPSIQVYDKAGEKHIELYDDGHYLTILNYNCT